MQGKKMNLMPSLNVDIDGQERKDISVLVSRFSLNLKKNEDKDFPEFNYKELLLSKQDNLKGTKLVSLNQDEDSDVKALAKQYEAKYGESYDSKNISSVHDFVDIGYGYDDSDTFIDNSEAYDEVIPSDWTTEHGGFYINQGELDFKPLDNLETTSVPKKKQKTSTAKKDVLLKVKKDNEQNKGKKKKGITKDKQRKNSLIKATKILVKKKKKAPVIVEESSQDVIPLAELNKSLEDDIPLSEIAKTSSDDNRIDEKVPLSKTTPISSIVTNQVKDSLSISQKATPSTVKPSEISKATTPKVFHPLPEGLADDLVQDINDLKKLSELSVKGKFFNPDVNKVLLRFARKCRQQAPKLRNAVYDHILYYLPCAKDTLVKRCRGLIVQHQRDLEDEPMKQLKLAIEASMPEQKENYDGEVAKALQEQAREQIKQNDDGVVKTIEIGEVPNVSDEKNKKTAVPKKKYLWSDKVRGLLCDVVKVRVGLFQMSKNRSSTAEEFIKDFLESEIRVMWPKGWMTSRILYRECRTAHQVITQPSKLKKSTKIEVKVSTAEPKLTSDNITVIKNGSCDIVENTPKVVAVKSSSQQLNSSYKSSITSTNANSISHKSPLNSLSTTVPTSVEIKTSNHVTSSSIKNLIVICSSVSKVSQNTKDVTSTTPTTSSRINTDILNSSMTMRVKEQTHSKVKGIGDTKLTEQASAFLKSIGSHQKKLQPVNTKISFAKVAQPLKAPLKKVCTSEKTSSEVSKRTVETFSPPTFSHESQDTMRVITTSQTQSSPFRNSFLQKPMGISNMTDILSTPSSLNTSNTSVERSPKLSPYLTLTPTTDSRSRQVKRKTLTSDSEDDISSKKSFSNKTAVSGNLSWSDMENNLARISKAASYQQNRASQNTSHVPSNTSEMNIHGISHKLVKGQSFDQKSHTSILSHQNVVTTSLTSQQFTINKPCRYANPISLQQQQNITPPNFLKVSQPSVQKTGNRDVLSSQFVETQSSGHGHLSVALKKPIHPSKRTVSSNRLPLSHASIRGQSPSTQTVLQRNSAANRSVGDYTPNIHLNQQNIDQTSFGQHFPTSPLNSALTASISPVVPVSSTRSSLPMNLHVPQHPAMRLTQPGNEIANYCNDTTIRLHKNTMETLGKPSHPDLKIMNELNRCKQGLHQIASQHSSFLAGSQVMVRKQSGEYSLSQQPVEQRKTTKTLTTEERIRMEQLQNEVMLRSKDYEKGYTGFNNIS